MAVNENSDLAADNGSVRENLQIVYIQEDIYRKIMELRTRVADTH
jgi:hypothetical protein